MTQCGTGSWASPRRRTTTAPHTARARELWEAARAEAARGTPPPQFSVMLDLVDAMLTAGESGPEHAVPKLACALREAVRKRCSETIRATLVDRAAGLLCELDDARRAARLIGAGERWRRGRPRPMPERAQVERAEAAARAVLGPGRYAAECRTGGSLTAEDVLRELGEAGVLRRA
ncbi:hypothetical protein [Streptomyces bullii]|uniref:Uncharacterized protein n=1 Tax=Streptomyces bullii TaxID=349910 RepID=A0ABW0UMC4_9ACTN